MGYLSFRKAVATELDPELKRTPGLSLTNRLLVGIIITAAAGAVVETEPAIAAGREWQFRSLEIAVGCIFLVEYLARLWIVPENPRHGRRRWARLRYSLSFPALIDLAAVVPILVPIGGGGSVFLRLVRIMRIIRLSKLCHLSRAWNDLVAAVHSRRYELWLTVSLAVILMLISSTLLYWAEGDVQPDKFGSIPRALWWSVVTLTTVGYGDVYPITPLGKLCSAIVSLIGIGLIALPTGILAAAFSEAVHRPKENGQFSEGDESD